MDIKTINNFLDKLDDANKLKCYISVNKNRFQTITKKSSKELNTKKIADLARDVIDSLSSMEIDPFKKKVIYQKLALVLNNYSRRVIKSKPWWVKILAFFGIVSQSERCINRVTKDLANRIDNLKYCEEVVPPYHQNVLQAHEEPLNKVKRFFAKMLETGYLRMYELDGYTQPGSLYSYLEDLKAYRQMLDSTSQPISQNLEQIIDELEEAYNISVTYALHNEAHTVWVRTHEEIQSLVTEISRKLKELPVSTENSRPSILIPKICKNHAIMCKIEKEQNDTFSFTIINTGDGVDVDWGNVFKVFVGIDDKILAQSIKYAHLTSDQISREFILMLVDSENANIKEFNDNIENLLMKNVKVKQMEGIKHKRQLKGTCAFKSTSATICEKLGKKEHAAFKAFLSEREIANFEHLDTSGILSEETKREMLKEGKKVLNHRQSKVS